MFIILNLSKLRARLATEDTQTKLSMYSAPKMNGVGKSPFSKDRIKVSCMLRAPLHAVYIEQLYPSFQNYPISGLQVRDIKGVSIAGLQGRRDASGAVTELLVEIEDSDRDRFRAGSDHFGL